MSATPYSLPLAHPEPLAVPILSVSPAVVVRVPDSSDTPDLPAGGHCWTDCDIANERSASSTSTVIRVATQQMYLKEEHQVGTHIHPMEGVIVDLTVVRNQIKSRLASDGEFCQGDEQALAEFDSVATTVKHLHAVDRAADLYKRQGPGGVTAYAKEHWRLAGLEVKAYTPDGAA